MIASVALTACTKDNQGEMAVNTINAINFTPVAGMNTKAPLSGTTYTTDLSFGTTAIYQNSNTTDNTTNTEFIPVSEVSYVGDVWKVSGTSYYWPRSETASLDFYSFSPYAAASYFKYTEGATNGWVISNYNVDSNQSYDIMIADAKTGCTYDKDGSGVATVFRHKLSYISAISIQTKSKYEGQTFKLKSITLDNINYVGTFDGDDWNATDDVMTKTLFSGETEFADEKVSVDVTSNKYYYVLPQTFADAKTMTVTYTVTTNSTTETVKASIKMSDIAADFDSFKMNLAYAFNLKVSENEIIWTPTVVDWENAGEKDVTFD